MLDVVKGFKRENRELPQLKFAACSASEALTAAEQSISMTEEEIWASIAKQRNWMFPPERKMSRVGESLQLQPPCRAGDIGTVVQSRYDVEHGVPHHVPRERGPTFMPAMENA